MIPVPPVSPQSLAVHPGAHQDPPSNPKTLPDYSKFPKSPPQTPRTLTTPIKPTPSPPGLTQTLRNPPSAPIYTSGHTKTPRKEALGHHEALRNNPEKSAGMLREPLWKKYMVLELKKHLRRDSEGNREGLRGVKRHQKVLGHNKCLQRGSRWYCGGHRARCGVL